MKNKYKKTSKSRSRSKSTRKQKQKQWQRQKQRQKQRERSRQREINRNKNQKDRLLKNRKKQYTSSSSSSSSSSGQRNQRSSNKQRHQQQINQQPKYKIQQTKILKIQNCSYLQAAQRALIDSSISAGTSVPDEVQLKQGSIYAKYPSIQVSSVVKQKLRQSILINGQQYRINFYPFKRIDLNAAYDWYCDRCDYKNFARRNKCYRCDNQKNENCKLNYNSTSIPLSKINKQQNINNCSLMIRGSIIIQTQQQILLDLFQTISSVKDIRMIKNKMTGQMKDFAFIQFFTPEDASLALKYASAPEFRIKGQKISVMYSRNKSDEDYAKPLPYEIKQKKKDFNKKQKKIQQPISSYYNRQRLLEIQQEKQRPLITLAQLKQKHQLQLKKKAANVRELTEEQSKRRQAQMMARQMEKQARIQNTVLYVCVPCRRKFKGQSQMKLHQENSEFHKFHKQKFQLSI